MATLNKKYQCQVNAIQTDCFVIPYFEKLAKGSRIPCCEVKTTVWDTGATNTIISPSIVTALGLKPYKKSLIEGVGGTMDSSVYKITIYTDNGIEFKSINALCGDIGDYDLIIGMDIIMQGDFVISNKDGATWFSFRYPSTEHIEL